MQLKKPKDVASHLAKIDAYESEILVFKSNLNAAKTHETNLLELQTKFSSISQEKEEYELKTKDLEMKLESARNLEIKLHADMTECQNKINDLSAAEERFQKNLSEATRNYKYNSFQNDL